ncbi:hypothetical protein PanWU01x14_352350, partial [Parasponia andersonii]
DVLKDKRDLLTQPVTRGSDIVSSSFEESNNDSLNTSDLAPTKVFAAKEEVWQEVQSKRKKKAHVV